MKPLALARLISRLPIEAPISDAAEATHWPHRDAYWPNQQARWLAALGLAGIGVPRARDVYDNIGDPAMLLWLIEAAGGDKARLRTVIKRAASLKRNTARCNLIRRAFPWRIVQSLLLERSPSK